MTTSFLAAQAYQELIEDGHPIVVCGGGDIAELLIDRAGVANAAEAAEWLARTFPLVPTAADANGLVD